jgi:1-deoxy-D-xylulose 5-phosphate reductoisomerase
MKKRTIIIYIVSALLLAAVATTAVFIYNDNKANQVQLANNGKEVTYKGKAGVTALALLSQKTKTTTSGTGANAFVTSIDSVTANPKSQYWAFYVNNKASMVGAGSYVTKSSDTITWKLTTF